MAWPRRIACATADNPGYMTDTGTNQYLLGERRITVIDVALASSANLERLLERAAAMGGRIEKILLTHIHRDHSGGALALRERTGARLGISRSRAGFLGGEDFTYGDGEEIAYDGGRLRVIHTPGHESGHCCFYEPEARVLFTGDHVLGRGTTVVPPPDGNMSDYLASLRKLLCFPARLLLPGHGPPIADARAKIEEYIEHRLVRERQVLEALAAGCRDLDSITARIYADAPAPLRSVARLTVEAHLIKLIQEGRVTERDGAYAIL
jgi:glyoxylase-like metal-dependent hydrolase (beta-lactamase superfamily II)